MGCFSFLQKLKNLSKCLQKSKTFQNDFLILGRVKKIVGPSTSFSTPNFLSGDSWKAFNFMIAFDHNLILRNFQIFAKNKNSPFSMPIYHQTRLDTEKKSCATTIGTEKRKKCTSQIFLILKIHHTLFLMIGRAFFKNSKCVK